MGHKETVMSYDELVKETGHPNFTPKEGREAQAKTSWEAGYEQREKEMNLQTVSLSEMLSNHRKAGIKEVVEWVESHEKSTCMDCLCAYDFRNEEWQAQKEKWEVKC